MRCIPLAVVGVLVCACGAETSGETDAGVPLDAPAPDHSVDASAVDAGQGPTRPDFFAPLQFEPCEGAFGGRALGTPVECADARVARDWSDPAGGAAMLRVERIATSGEPRVQIWMLQGGPGASSLEFEVTHAPIVAAAIEGAEILLVDHRGVGFSDRLDCPVQEAMPSEGGARVTESELAGCLRSLATQYTPEQLAVYSTTSAARDLGNLIERARRPGVPAFVYGVSYGTYWAQRYLALFPDQAAGVILDSVCSPDTCRVPIASLADAERAGHALLAMCAADEPCAARVGGDPIELYRGVLDRLEGGTCEPVRALGYDRQRVRAVVGTLLSSVRLRQAIPALIARLDRCAPEDVEALAHLAGVLGITSASTGTPRDRLRWSEALHLLVRRSEMWEEPSPPWSEVLAATEESLFWPVMQRHVYETWESMARYPRDEHVGRFAETAIPMLMMNGTLDPQTSLLDALPASVHFDAPDQQFVVIERGAHGLLAQSPYDDEPERTCALDLIRAFVRDPRGPLDTSCRTETSRVDFTDDGVAPLLFGTSSLWDPVPRAYFVLGPREARVLEDARRVFERAR